MAVTTARPRRVSPVPSYVLGALGGLLFGYDLGLVAGALLASSPSSAAARSRSFVTSSLLLEAP